MTMTVDTATTPTPTPAVPEGAVRVHPGGLLASVRRPCPDHPGPECACVARRPDRGCLVFWCAQGAHHFTAR